MKPTSTICCALSQREAMHRVPPAGETHRTAIQLTDIAIDIYINPLSSAKMFKRYITGSNIGSVQVLSLCTQRVPKLVNVQRDEKGKKRMTKWFRKQVNNQKVTYNECQILLTS